MEDAQLINETHSLTNEIKNGDANINSFRSKSTTYFDIKSDSSNYLDPTNEEDDDSEKYLDEISDDK